MVFLLPFLLAVVAAASSRKVAIWLPSFSMYQCGDWDNRYVLRPVDAYNSAMNLALMTWINYEFILCTLFFLCTFWLRSIRDEFSIN